MNRVLFSYQYYDKRSFVSVKEPRQNNHFEPKDAELKLEAISTKWQMSFAITLILVIFFLCDYLSVTQNGKNPLWLTFLVHLFWLIISSGIIRGYDEYTAKCHQMLCQLHCHIWDTEGNWDQLVLQLTWTALKTIGHNEKNPGLICFCWFVCWLLTNDMPDANSCRGNRSRTLLEG